MGRAQKLLQKLEKNKQKVDKNFNKYYGILHENPEVYDIIEDTVEPTVLEQSQVKGFSTTSHSLQRVDYEFPNENYGLELTVPPGIIITSGIGSGDEVEIIGGTLEGWSVEVIEIINSTTLRLDDVSIFSGKEIGVPVKFILNKE